MAMIAAYRIETFCAMYWTGGGFSYDERDAKLFDDADEALEEIATLGLLDVYAERFERSVPARTVYAATEERRVA